MRNGDVNKIKSLISKGCDVNTIVSDVYQDTVLIWSVKHSFLEIVELLVQVPGCQLDLRDRYQHSALDEAIKAWLNGTGTKSSPATPTCPHTSFSKHLPLRQQSSGSTKSCSSTSSLRDSKLQLGGRYRILKCLLEAGGQQVSVTHLDMLVFRTLSVPIGPTLVEKLAKLVSERGHKVIQSVLLSVMVSYKHTHDSMKLLLEAGANPSYYLTKEPARPFMPVENALLLLTASNDQQLLCRIECDTTGQLQQVGDLQWEQLQHVLRLLVVCGHSLQLYVRAYLRDNHSDFYVWVLKQDQKPRSLKSLTRIALRKSLYPNVLYAANRLSSLPEGLQNYLLFPEWLVPKQKSIKLTSPSVNSIGANRRP